MKFSTKQIIVCLCAVVVTAVLVGGVVLGASVLADTEVAGRPATENLPDSGKVNTDDVNKEGEPEKTTDDSSQVTEIPDVVKTSPLPGDSFDSMIDLYAKCSQSCVSIICVSEYEYDYGFYKDKYEATSLGSGFIVEGEKNGVKKNYIVTNHHVIEGAKSIEVKFYNSEITYKAELIGSDATTDIAVLTIDKNDMTPIEIGDSDALQVGQWVVAIGTPADLALEGTMTYGIISGLNRALDIENDQGTVTKTMNVIQTSAEINPGNSGGPLINMAGQVIGINTMKTTNYESLGFALPSSKAVDIINQIIVNGKVTDRDNTFVTSSAQLGISGATVTDELRKTYNLPDDAPDGVLIITVSRGTAVYEAGLSIYDIITEFDGEKVTSIEQLKELISKHSAGDKVSMRYYSPGQRPGEKSEYVDCTFVLDGVAE